MALLNGPRPRERAPKWTEIGVVGGLEAPESGFFGVPVPGSESAL